MPVSATTQTLSSLAAASTASTTPQASSVESAFFFSGRFSVMVRTWPASATFTSSVMATSPAYAFEGKSCARVSTGDKRRRVKGGASQRRRFQRKGAKDAMAGVARAAIGEGYFL